MSLQDPDRPEDESQTGPDEKGQAGSPEWPQDANQKPGAPFPPGLNINPEALARAAQEGQEAANVAGLTDAHRLDQAEQMLSHYGKVWTFVGIFLSNQLERARTRGAINNSSRDTAFWEGRRDMAMDTIEALGQFMTNEGEGG